MPKCSYTTVICSFKTLSYNPDSARCALLFKYHSHPLLLNYVLQRRFYALRLILHIIQPSLAVESCRATQILCIVPCCNRPLLLNHVLPNADSVHRAKLHYLQQPLREFRVCHSGLVIQPGVLQPQGRRPLQRPLLHCKLHMDGFGRKLRKPATA